MYCSDSENPNIFNQAGKQILICLIYVSIKLWIFIHNILQELATIRIFLTRPHYSTFYHRGWFCPCAWKGWGGRRAGPGRQGTSQHKPTVIRISGNRKIRLSYQCGKFWPGLWYKYKGGKELINKNQNSDPDIR